MSLIQQVLPFFLIGARNTLIYCFVSFPLALLLGLLLAVMRNSRIAWFSSPAKIYIEVIRDTPIIAQILLIYYGLGAILVNFNLSTIINAWTGGIAVLALNYAAYEAEVFRAGFLSVEHGQTEAALSLGMTSGQNFFRIVLPQAIPLMIPPFVNDFIYMLKDSAIVSVISGYELTSQLQYYAFRYSADTIPLYTLAIVLYLLMSLPISYVARWYERRLRAAL